MPDHADDPSAPADPAPAHRVTAASCAVAPARVASTLHEILPGLLLVAAITAAAHLVRQLPGVGLLSPMILAIALGAMFHNLAGTPRRALPGVRVSMRPLLRLAIVLLGLQLTFAQVLQVGGRGMAVIVVTLVASFLFTRWAGARLGVERKLAELIAAGTAVCGASAVIAANTVTRGSEEDAAYAVACVTVFGTAAMFVLPVLGTVLGLDDRAYGLWAGASIHEVAQVVAAAFQHGQAAGEFGTVAKLSRVMLLAPLVLALGWGARRLQRNTSTADADGAGTQAPVPVPWFVLGFVALVVLNSLVALPPPAQRAAASITAVLLTMALAAMGLSTDVRRLKATGVRPLALGAVSWVFIAGFSLAAIVLLDRGVALPG